MPKIIGIYDSTEARYKKTIVLKEYHQTLTVEFQGDNLNNLGFVTKQQRVGLLDAASAIPEIAEQNTIYPGLYALGVEYIFKDDFPNLAWVEVDWQTPSNLQDLQRDPTKQAVLISAGTYKQQDTPDFDFDGKPVATTAGEPINYVYQRGYPTYTFDKNLAQFPTWTGRDRDFVNNDAVTIFGINFKPYELYLPDVEVSSLQFDATFRYYNFKGTIYVCTKENGWKTRLRNAGYHERKSLGFFSAKGQQLAKFFEPFDKEGTAKVKIGTTTYFNRYGLAAIKMNIPGRYEYASSPVLLNLNGRAFRSQIPGEPPNTGPVVGLQSPDNQAASSGISKKDWDAAVIELRFFNPISFNTCLPLR